MKTLIVFCCLVAAIFASSFKFKFKEGSAIYDAIAHTASMVHKRDTVKRDAIAMAFRLIDTDKDGHINGNEIAAFYANAHIPGLVHSQSRLRQLFYLALPQVDTNGNEELEIGEFRSIAERGMRGDTL
ncbi:uncharacterized protein LOC134683391 isoform X1 [Mytilus trossulus]|uniref:uncharacterized protein LOC134683391 isoform X1 n=1 Tax=Mytilus trossulus TaxID=6551 RepID=UPI0030068401